jgi:hypothetical protein
MMPVKKLGYLTSVVSIMIFTISIPAFSETWEKTYPNPGYDRGGFVQQTADGGYIIVGNSHATRDDIILIKTDAAGEKLWSSTFGGSGGDDVYIGAHSLQQTQDGGYIIYGNSDSFSTAKKSFLIKTNANGAGVWSKTVDGTGMSVKQTSDGGYILVGTINSQAFLLKTDANGNQVWIKTYGTNTHGGGAYQTQDGGFVVTGRNSANLNSGIYLVKTDSNGNPFWSKTLGESADWGHSVLPARDGGYIIFGAPWEERPSLTKTDSNGNQVWHKTYSGLWQEATWGEQTSDGGYILAASRDAAGWGATLLKTDPSGNETWRKTFGNGEGKAVRITRDGGYIMVGYTGEDEATDVYLVYYKPSPPNTAISPAPSDNSNEVCTNPTLSWVSSETGLSYDVYLGTSPTLKNSNFMGNQIADSFKPGKLRRNTAYYWRIDSKNNFGTTTGEVWSFETGVKSCTQSGSWNLLLLFND